MEEEDDFVPFRFKAAHKELLEVAVLCTDGGISVRLSHEQNLHRDKIDAVNREKLFVAVANKQGKPWQRALGRPSSRAPCT